MSTALLTPRSTDRAFERLYRRHVHEVYRYVLAVLRNQADAEDATQATFLSAFRAFSAGEEPRKPRNWLLKIAHNECRQRFRASARRPQEVEWDERTPAPAPDESVPSAEDLRAALAHLSFNQRSALVMRELEGRTYAEIAEILDLSSSAVETVLFRARRALREQLEGSLTCGEAEATLSRRMDKRLASADQRALRAHLRECSECAALERKQRARQAALKRGLGAVQLPPSLASFLGGSGSVTGGAAVAGSGLAAKGAAVVAAGVLAGGAAHEARQVLIAPEPASAAPQVAVRETQSSVNIAVRRQATVPRRAKATQGDSARAASPARLRKVVKAAPGRRSKGERDGASPDAPPATGGGSSTGSSPATAPTGKRKAPAPAVGGINLPAVPQPAAPQPVRQVVEPVVETVKQVVEPVVETVKQVVEPVVEPVRQVVEPVVEPVKQVLEPVVEPVKQVLEPVVEPVKRVLPPLLPPPSRP